MFLLTSINTTSGKYFLPHLSLYTNCCLVCDSLVHILSAASPSCTPAGEVPEDLGRAPVPHPAHSRLSCGMRQGSSRHYPPGAWKLPKAGDSTTSLHPGPAARLCWWAKGSFLSPAWASGVSLYHHRLSSSHHVLLWKAWLLDDLFIDRRGLCHGGFFGSFNYLFRSTNLV